MTVTRLPAIEQPKDLTPEERNRFEATWSAPRGLVGAVREINNIPIARRYMIAGFSFFLAGGVLALLMRIQLGTPENTFLSAETYNQLFTMHGTTMMFLFVIPFIEAIANYLLPLQLGTRDMPFPRLTALSFWTYVFGGIFLYASFAFGLAPDGGWFAYLPLNNVEWSPGLNMDFWDIGLSVAEVAAIGAAAEITVAILRMRAPGMTLARMPLFCWAMLVTAFMIIFAFTPLIVGTALLELDRKGLTSFFKPALGGDPLLWQHLFWTFGHPEVYIMFLPAVGIISQVVQTFSRRPIVGYPLMVVAIVTTGVLSFGLWVHHMFVTGVADAATSFFTATSTVIAIPAGVQVFCWIATIGLGRPVWRTPMLFAVGFLIIFTIGGVTGFMLGAVPFDQQAHDSFFVVAHFHYVLIGGVLFPLFAGLYYWLPKITGRMLSERLGRWNFWCMFIFFNVTFFPMHSAGLLGMPRRVYTYPSGLGWDTYNLISTLGAFGFGAGIALFLINVAWSSRKGVRAGPNPWQADSLEWSQDSPPAQAQFQTIPVVSSRHPLWEQDTLADVEGARAAKLESLNWRPLDWRGALVVSVSEAEPKAIVHMPTSTAAPFLMAVGFVFLFAAALVEHLLLFAIGAVITVAVLIGWFLPQRTERIALEEARHASSTHLPLAIAGPNANGYWGTVVLLLVLFTALATLIAVAFYLGLAPDRVQRAPTDWLLPVMIAAAFLGGAGQMAWLTRTLRAGRAARGTGQWLLTAIAAAAGTWLLARAYVAAELVPAAAARDAAIAALLVFQVLVGSTLLCMTTCGLAWSLLRPGDLRGQAVAWNTSLIAYFAAGSSLIVLLTVYAVPRFW